MRGDKNGVSRQGDNNDRLTCANKAARFHTLLHNAGTGVDEGGRVER